MLDKKSFNRELSWLDFNDRVLSLAFDTSLPLLERVRFAAIAASNLDEFFQVRVAALMDRLSARAGQPGPDGTPPAEVLATVRGRAADMAERHDKLVLDILLPELASCRIEIASWGQLTPIEEDEARELYERLLHPVLTPLAVDRAHPFPTISNLSLNIGALVSGRSGALRFARVKVPEVLPRFVKLECSGRYVLLEEIVSSQLKRLFGDVPIVAYTSFRVARKTEIEVDGDDADDLIAAIEVELRRHRFGRPVRLEIDSGADPRIVDLLVDELELRRSDVVIHQAPLGMAALHEIASIDRRDLRFPRATPVVPQWAFHQTGPAFFSAMAVDRVVHHPYESFAATVTEFVRVAARDPQTQAIKMTLYRTSRDGVLIDALVEAAERGVQVVALIELFARFDERANVEWARRLEDAGAHVVYGLVGLKTHSKCLLVVRREDDRMTRYCHLGTGNYNATTANVYEDLSLFTTDPEIGADLTELFNELTGFSEVTDYRQLVVAPKNLRLELTRLIEREMSFGETGRIVIKVNSIVDEDMIQLLYAASRAGVEIDIIVRGVCSLRPGAPGMSETIRVRSVLGRFLEHSRIYRFGHGGDSGPRYLIGSADLMERNLERRVEVLVPIRGEEGQARLDQIIEANLADARHVWVLDRYGRWTHAGTGGGESAQSRLARLAAG